LPEKDKEGISINLNLSMRIVDKQIKHMRKLFHSYPCFIIRLEPCWIKLAGLCLWKRQSRVRQACIYSTLHRLAKVKAGTLVGNFLELDESVSVYATSRIKHNIFLLEVVAKRLLISKHLSQWQSKRC